MINQKKGGSERVLARGVHKKNPSEHLQKNCSQRYTEKILGFRQREKTRTKARREGSLQWEGKQGGSCIKKGGRITKKKTIVRGG